MIGSMLRKAMLAGGTCTATMEPDVVTGLVATPSGSTTINLVWDADTTAAPNQATSYEVWRSADGNAPWTQIATVTAPTVSYSDTSLSASTTRYYRVNAVNCFDTANPSSTANATTSAGGLTPAWSIDWSTGTPSGYTLTRASSGTYVDSSGYIASASTDVARLTHNSSGTRLGLLVEESRTNYSEDSEAITGAAWTRQGLTGTANDIAAPDNATTADKMLETATTANHWLFQTNPSWSGAPNGDKTVSVFLKGGLGRDWVKVSLDPTTDVGVWFDITNGTVGNADSGCSGRIEDYGNGWYRCFMTRNLNGNMHVIVNAALSNGGSKSYAGDATKGFYIWGTQLEAGDRATSYIPTTGGADVTRSADLAHVLDSNITSWGDPGALVIHFYPPGQAGTLLSTDDASTAQVGIEASSKTAARAFWSSGNTATGTIGTGVQKAVHYWNGSTSKFAINGSTPVSGTNNLTIGNTDFVTLGAEATDSSNVPGTFSQYANCVIRKVEFYSGTLTDANLQTVTT